MLRDRGAFLAPTTRPRRATAHLHGNHAHPSDTSLIQDQTSPTCRSANQTIAGTHAITSTSSQPYRHRRAFQLGNVQVPPITRHNLDGQTMALDVSDERGNTKPELILELLMSGTKISAHVVDLSEIPLTEVPNPSLTEVPAFDSSI
jgi:hypothetical protein